MAVSRLAKDLSLGVRLADSSEGLLTRGKGRARIHRSFCSKKQVVGTSKDNYELKEKQRSQVNDFSTFLCVGRYKHVGSLKSSL